MNIISRRTLMQGFFLLAASPVLARNRRSVPVQKFTFDALVQRARDLSKLSYEEPKLPLPSSIENLDFDGYRTIRFRPNKAFLNEKDSAYRLQLFHLGFLYRLPVTVNLLKDGIPLPIPYRSDLFEFGKTKISPSLSVNAGFAGLRLHYPLNQPDVFDELISFLGASYFRFLGRGQHYGLSARGIAVNAAHPEIEEFPRFREFWVDQPAASNGRVVVYALLDGPSVTGAYEFQIYPDNHTSVDVHVALFPRKSISSIGLAPLTSMYFTGENNPKKEEDFRDELHDSDGLLMHTGKNEWIWRPLQNPNERQVSSFKDTIPKGFGLMQRDRFFRSYQDLEALYHKRPSYWIEPLGNWGEGHVELIEMPTNNETQDNIVCYWKPDNTYEVGKEYFFSYNIKALNTSSKLHTGGQVVNTFVVPTRASGSTEPSDPSKRRFIIDFAGGKLDYFQAAPQKIELVPSTRKGTIMSTFLIPNPEIKGFRAALDISLAAKETTDIRAYLKVGDNAVTETWTYLWKSP